MAKDFSAITDKVISLRKQIADSYSKYRVGVLTATELAERLKIWQGALENIEQELAPEDVSGEEV